MFSEISNTNKIEKYIVDSILTTDLSYEGVKKIIEALKIKGNIVSAILPKTPESETFGNYLQRFWDYDKSPYVIEKKAVGQSIHRRYVDTNLKRVKAYWIPKYGNKLLGEITLSDIKKNLKDLATKPQLVGTAKKDKNGKRVKIQKKLKSETVNQIVRAATLALKWAYHNKLTKNDCFSGIIWCHVVPEKRIVPTISDTKKIFSANWKNNSACLANLISICTGMRIGEIQALQLKDIGKDRIFVRHNWAKGEGLKCPKNGCQREILVGKSLMTLIYNYARKNPYGQNPSNFLFWGTTQGAPRPTNIWNKELHKVTKQLEIKNSSHITFHCWRHFFATNMADNVDMRKLKLVTGHKSLEMLEHYAKHESEQTINELGKITEKIFSPIVDLVKLG